MRVQEVMTEDVQTISAAMAADDAWNLMRMKRVHHLVITHGRHIAGLASDRDLGGRQGAPVRANRNVGDLMTKPVVTVPPDTPLRKAANLMRGRSSAD